MIRLLVASLIALGVAAAPAMAGPADVANDISNEIMSPFCDGVTLHDCPSQEAVALRDRIEAWARRGWTGERIMTRLEAEYGPSIRATPPRDGFGIVAWILPALVVAAGAAGVWKLARTWTRPAVAEAGETPRQQMSPEEQHRLDAELSAMRSRT